MIQAAAGLRDDIKVIYLENYNMALAMLITSGVDLWLNTPQRPQEASGTSGMKAALNGVPSLSVLDGWWVEGCVEGVTGWAIGYDTKIDGDESAAESASLYDKLEQQIIPMYYRAPEAYAQIMRSCISLERELLQHAPHVEPVQSERLLAENADQEGAGSLRAHLQHALQNRMVRYHF